ncbi:MAG TPA: heme exporter protein CcmD [Rhodospirillaceae bacterium]|nr:heme exporter protein CcmD [Rhodospirillaceae bacterium]
MTDYFAMNGYGFYIWGAYGATALILFALFAATLYKSRKLKRERDLLEGK